MSPGIPNLPSDIASMIASLSRRPGTIATILLDTSSGCLIHGTGHLPSTMNKSGTFNKNSSGSAPDNWTTALATATNDQEPTQTKSPKEEELQLLASLAMGVVRSAGVLVENIDPEDQTKLLRLRTKK
jgi:dynein light chain roadblock-type